MDKVSAEHIISTSLGDKGEKQNMELQQLKDMLRIDGNYDDLNLTLHLEAAKSYVRNSVNNKENIETDPRFKMVVGLLAASWYENKSLTSEGVKNVLPHSFYSLIQQLDFATGGTTEPVEPTEPTEPTEPVKTINIDGVDYEYLEINELSFKLKEGQVFDKAFLAINGANYGVLSSTAEETTLAIVEKLYASNDYGDQYNFSGYVKDSKFYFFSGDSPDKGLIFYVSGTKYTFVNQLESSPYEVWSIK